ncbi:MAG: hypothetical protein JXA42_26065 [Anaerolineales bacterium]|nr:hypothetical protein [Anaerolineales bacterium]
MELEANYGYLNWIGGKSHRQAPLGLGRQTPPARPARGRDRDTLFVHLTLSSRETPSPSLYREVVDELANAFFATNGSVTAALRQSVRAANEYLMRYNLREEGVDKQRGSVTCAVLRDEELFIGQAGDTLAFISHQGQLERLPPRVPGLITPLGVGYGVDTRFYHSWIHPGDMLLLANPSFSPHQDSIIAEAITYEGITAGIDNLTKICKSTSPVDARIMLVEFSVGQVAETSPEPKREPQPAPVKSVARVTAKPVREQIRPSSQPRPDTVRTRPQPVPEPTTSIPKPDIQEKKKKARRVASGVALWMAAVTAGMSQMVERLFGGEETTGQAVKRDQGPSAISYLLMAVLIPILVGVVSVTVYLQRGQTAKFQDLLLQLERESNLAIASETELEQRSHWTQVIAISDQALQLYPSHETVLLFQEQATEKLDVLDEITRLVVQPLYQYKSGSVPTGLAVQSLNVYVLDTEIDYAYKHLLEDQFRVAKDVEPETILFKTQAVGGEAVSDLVDINWFPKSGEMQQDSITILDSAGLLLRYRPAWGNVLSTQLVLPANWSTPQATTVYGDNFYVLDIGAKQVWRFEAKDKGYPSEPTMYQFDNNTDSDPANDVDLSLMIDMSIDRDGNLYLLQNDGQILKFFSGERKHFVITDLEDPLVAPTAIFCSLTGLNPLFYIADPGSGRIVQTTQQGLFMAQYRAKGAGLVDPFSAITDIYVIETPILAIYATSGESLIVGSLE